MSLKLTGHDGCPEISCILLWRISLSNGISGTMGLD